MINNKASLYLNGEDQKSRYILKQNYSVSWMEKVPELHNGYMLEYGRYTWDKSLIFGTWVDFNMWDSLLSDDKMERYSSCREIVKRQGSLVEGNTPWDIRGEIIKQVGLD